MRLATLRTNSLKWVYFIIFLLAFLVLANYLSVYAFNTENTDVTHASRQQLKQNTKAQVLGMFTPTTSLDSTVPSVDEVFDKVNLERAKNGLEPLVKNSVLTEVALARARDMKSQNYYAHADKDGLYFYDMLVKQNYDIGFACENLDMSFSNKTSSYVADWMNSRKGHKECLLDSKITYAGYALFTYGDSEDSSDETAYLVVAVHAEIK